MSDNVISLLIVAHGLIQLGSLQGSDYNLSNNLT